MPSEPDRRPNLVPATTRFEPVVWGSDILAIPYTEPLVDGIIDLDSTALLYGESWSGKSVVALDIGLSISTGISWFGHAVDPGKVLYIVGEGLTGTRERVEAWMIARDIKAIPQAGFIRRATNLLSEEGRTEFKFWVDSAMPVLTIIDTVARHIPGGEENEFKTISHVVEMMDWARTTTGGCCLAIGHTGKDGEKGHRGHSSLKAAVDTEIRCSRGVTGPILTCTKQKNGEGGWTKNFELEKIPLATNTGDKKRISVALKQTGKTSNPSDNIIVSVFIDAGPDSAFTYSEVKSRAIAKGLPEKTAEGALRRLRVSRVIGEGSEGNEGKLTLTGY